MTGKLRLSTGAGIGRAGMPSRRKRTRAFLEPRYGLTTSKPQTDPALSVTSRARQPLLAGHTKLFLRLSARDHRETPEAFRGAPGVNVKREYSPIYTSDQNTGWHIPEVPEAYMKPGTTVVTLLVLLVVLGLPGICRAYCRDQWSRYDCEGGYRNSLVQVQ